MKLLFLIPIFLFLAGCAHTYAVLGPDRVAVGAKHVNKGDRLYVDRVVCKKKVESRAGELKDCRHQRAGEAVVVEVVNADESVVAPENFTMDTSMRVQRAE